jgi:hypothetical protein
LQGFLAAELGRLEVQDYDTLVMLLQYCNTLLVGAGVGYDTLGFKATLAIAIGAGLDDL